MIASSRQTRRRIGVLLASLLLAILSFLTLIQDESASKLLDELSKEQHNQLQRDGGGHAKAPASKPNVHIVVVACEGKSKSAVDEAHNMIKSAILLSIDPKIKVRFIMYESV